MVTADMLQCKQQIYNNTISIHCTTGCRYATLRSGVPQYKQHPTMGAEEVMYQCILTTNPGGINTKPFFLFCIIYIYRVRMTLVVHWESRLTNGWTDRKTE